MNVFDLNPSGYSNLLRSDGPSSRSEHERGSAAQGSRLVPIRRRVWPFSVVSSQGTARTGSSPVASANQQHFDGDRGPQSCGFVS